MSSSVAIDHEGERTAGALFEIAARLAGRRVVLVEPVRGGGNNRLHRVVAADGTALALKSYLRDADDRRDRLGTEFAALRFLAAQGAVEVPPAVASDPESGHALYGWVAGEAVGLPAIADIEAAAAFAARLKQFKGISGAKTLPQASEACLGAFDLVSQVEARFTRLLGAAAPRGALQRFLLQEMRPALDRHICAARLAYDAAGLDFAAPLGPEFRTLSPSDFGFHNALRDASGRLVFLDFEYFGWDDPVKLTADFLWHPGMALEAKLRRHFTALMVNLFRDDPHFRVRLGALYPLYGLRWTAIVLNEFLPERWRRRVFAGLGGGPTDRLAILSRQLARAQGLVRRLEADKGDLSDDA